jgi:hypothetical protein
VSSGTDAKPAPDGSLSLCWFWLLLIIYTCELGHPSACKAARRGNRRLLLDPAPDLPDDTEINRIQLPTRIRTVLNKASFKTIGEIRQSSDGRPPPASAFWTGFDRLPSKGIRAAILICHID